jgi:hypothetical protein
MPPIVVPTAAASAAESAGALRLGARFVHRQRASAGIGAAERGDGSVGFVIVCHLYKAEPAGAASIAIGNYSRALDRAVWLKPLTQVGFGGAEREVSYKYLFHGNSFEFRLGLPGRRRFRCKVGLRSGHGVLVRKILCRLRHGRSQLTFELALQLTLLLGASLFLARLFFLAFVEGRACSW